MDRALPPFLVPPRESAKSWDSLGCYIWLPFSNADFGKAGEWVPYRTELSWGANQRNRQTLPGRTGRLHKVQTGSIPPAMSENQLESRPSLRPAHLIPQLAVIHLPTTNHGGSRHPGVDRRRSQFAPGSIPVSFSRSPRRETHACGKGQVHAAVNTHLQDRSDDHMTPLLPTAARKRWAFPPPGIHVVSFAAVVQTLRCTFVF